MFSTHTHGRKLIGDEGLKIKRCFTKAKQPRNDENVIKIKTSVTKTQGLFLLRHFSNLGDNLSTCRLSLKTHLLEKRPA